MTKHSNTWGHSYSNQHTVHPQPFNPATVISLLHFIDLRDGPTETCSHPRFSYVLQPGELWKLLVSYGPCLKNPSTRGQRDNSAVIILLLFQRTGVWVPLTSSLASTGTRHACKQNIHKQKMKINKSKKQTNKQSKKENPTLSTRLGMVVHTFNIRIGKAEADKRSVCLRPAWSTFWVL